MVKIAYILVFLIAFIYLVTAENKVICYYGTWATYRNGNGKCEVKDLNPHICSHLIYGFVGINEDATIRIMDPWLELPDNWGKDNFGEFNRLKKANPNLKTIVAIGGWNEGSAKFSKVANDQTLRENFARNAAEFTAKYGFDGMDMDWEYPSQRDSTNKDTDKPAFSLLLAEMRKEFDKKQLSLSAAVAAVNASASLSYDIPTISKYLDFINVMSYDLHGAWDPVTGYNAALKRYDAEDLPVEASLNVETAIDYWLSAGAPKEKIVMGIPLYGRSFRLANQAQNTVGSPSTGAGIAGQYTSENGMIGYNELCEKRLNLPGAWPEKWDDQASVPYTFNNADWISYDNELSIKMKVEYALSKGLSGVMVWSIETDDFRGVCQSTKYPLLRLINEVAGRVIGGSNVTTTTISTSSSQSTQGPTISTTNPPATGMPTSTSASTLTSTSTTTDPSTSPGSVCKKPGYFRNEDDCNKFYQCVLDSDTMSYRVYYFSCPSGLFFDADTIICNFPHLVDC
ncbi:chitinase-3-like protein 1 [Arctopsyche grandis]|uniref:chitinase-3-like protein 1 n=1 Tax=Arctopsyche grandis TaxID=121162 RepID=UPI00406D76F7